MAAQASVGSKITSFLAGTTLRVVAAVLFVLAMVAYFESIPTAFRWPLRVLWFGSVLWLLFVTVKTVKNTRFTVKKTIFILVLGGFYYLILTVVCAIFIKVMSKRDDRLTVRGMTELAPECRQGIEGLIGDKGFNMFSKEIGWMPRPNYKSGNYSVSKQGLRGTREYPETAPDPAKRIMCVGDSFTFGISVGDQETYPYQAEQLVPGTEWLNFGIPGGCLTQAYLRYQKEKNRFGGKYVVIGFMTNDAQRTVNCFRPFVNADSGCPYTKPFAKYANGKLSIEPNPYDDLGDFKNLLANSGSELGKLRALDYLAWSKQGGNPGAITRTLVYISESLRVDRNIYSLFDRKLSVTGVLRHILPVDPYGRMIWQPESPGFKAITGLVDKFYAEVIADGRIPVFVIIPGPLDVDDYRKQFPCQYTSLVNHCTAKNYRFVDFLGPLIAKHKADLSTETLFLRSHYKGPLNKELAGEIIKALQLP